MEPWNSYYALITLGVLTTLAASLDTSRCLSPLGLESGSVKDDDITASSSFDGASVGPHNARVRIERNGGAWCPRQQATHQPRDWLQIDLRSDHVVTAVETQGRFGNGQGQEFAEHYMIEYWREALGKWVRYKDHKGEEVIQGNTNTYTAEKRDLDPVILGRKIRFYPYSHHRRTVCMRVELYGCPWYEGIVSYSMPQGDQRGTGWQFYDTTYDGIWDGSLLRQGLGLLTDGKFGPDNFKNSYYSGDRAQGWVGWRNDSRGGQPVEIVFEFDTIRDFTLVNIFTNNQFTKDIQIFSEVQIHFSVGGQVFPGEPIIHRPMEDRIFENSRNVTVKLLHRVGKFVKLRLFFASRWILISEVSFRSEPVTANYSAETVTTQTAAPSNPVSVTREDEWSPQQDEETQGTSDGQAYLAILVGVLVAVSVLLAAAIFTMILRHRHRKSLASPLPNKSGWNDSAATPNHQDAETRTHHPRNDCAATQYLLPPMNGPHLLMNKAEVLNIGSEYQEPLQTPRFSPYGYSTLLLAGSDPLTSRSGREISEDLYDYAVPDVRSVPLISAQPRSQLATTGQLHVERDRESLLSSNSSSKNSRTSFTDLASKKPVDRAELLAELNSRAESLLVPEIPRGSIRMVERISSGVFGTIYVAESDNVPDYGSPAVRTRKLMAIKFLPSTTSKNKIEFYQEVRLLAALDNPNLSRVLGISTSEEPFCVIMEYLTYGDLHQFLKVKRHVPEPVPASIPHTSDDGLTLGSLLYIGRQIASGMRYLESLNFVHRDLATRYFFFLSLECLWGMLKYKQIENTRNCLIGEGLCVKISDFGTDSEKYHSDYYRLEGQLLGLPIRWMAWESLVQGKYTTKSDVWSFAVTLWEILNLARQRPYSELDDDSVLDNSQRLGRGEQPVMNLQKPTYCPRDIFDLMCECWRRLPTERPSFREIHLFLQRKNLGYSPL